MGTLFSTVLISCADATPSDPSADETVDSGKHPGRTVTNIHETLLYIAAIEDTAAGATASPDALFTVDVKPGSWTYGKIINRTDMPNVGDELHHFGYDWDQNHLLVNGLFSERMHVINVHTDPRHPTIESVNTGLAAASGYAVPHTVIPMPNGHTLLSMIGSANGLGAPGGIVEVDSHSGNFISYFGDGPTRDYTTDGPEYMYDMGLKPELNRMITTTFGLPKDIAGSINPAGLGNEVCVWDSNARRVIQRVDLGANTGALEARWTNTYGEPVGYTNTPGTGAIWAWEDFDGDGVYQFHEVLTGLGMPTDLVMSTDSKFLYAADFALGRVFQINIQDRLHPTITATVNVPHAQMMRLSQDNSRLFVTNSLLSTWDDDANPTFGGPRNTNYGIYLINANPTSGGMTLVGNPLVDFSNVQKKNARGAMRPHQVFFDPAVVFPYGFH